MPLTTPTYFAIGKARHRLAIQALTQTPDTFGQNQQTWTTIANVWGFIRPLAGKEAIQQGTDQLRADISHEISTRWLGSTITLDSTCQIIHNNRTFRIQSVINVEERNVTYKLMCLEITTGDH